MQTWRDHPIRLPQVLTDGVVRLDSPRLEDAEAHWSGEDFEMIRRFDAPLLRKGTLEQVRAVMAEWAIARATGGPMFVYAIRAPEGPLAGGCELRRPTEALANVSYWIYPPFRGLGYAARALRLLSRRRAAFRDLSASRRTPTPTISLRSASPRRPASAPPATSSYRTRRAIQSPISSSCDDFSCGQAGRFAPRASSV
jgi:RimJ/RimL family protein N-acetyltransferase